jgi:hypothetical protein
MLFTMAFRRPKPKTMVFFYPGLPGQVGQAFLPDSEAMSGRKA